MAANERQIGGKHYQGPLQHWDLVVLYLWDYFQSQIFRYVMRWRDKDGIKDLKKAHHFLEKYIELVEGGKVDLTPRAALPRDVWLSMLGAVDFGATVTTNVICPEGFVAVPSGSVHPTGWRGFTYEGSKDVQTKAGEPAIAGDLYRCVKCKSYVVCLIDHPPCNRHVCGVLDSINTNLKIPEDRPVESQL